MKNPFCILVFQIIFFVFWAVSCNSDHERVESLTSQEDSSETHNWWYTKAEKMVKEQIESRGITEARLLYTMKKTPRHRFVPTHLIPIAYNDYPLPIGHGQTISQPYIVALMTDLLDLSGQEKVLEIGTGSGYQAAILSSLAKEVYTIEIVKALSEEAQQKLKELGYSNNVHVKWGDGYKGWPEHAPFDCVIVTAAPEIIPETLIKQLKTGGKMVVPVGKGYQELMVIQKTEKGITKKSIIPVRFVPMVHPDSHIP